MTETYRNKLSYTNNPRVVLEIMDFVIGDHLASGAFRDVYEYPLDKKWVVKVENSNGYGENWAEYRLWHCVKGTEHEKWFAPCKWISTNGLVLMQKRTEDFYGDDKKWKKHVPEKIPAYFDDVKTDNFGWNGKQLVCHDYSYTLEKMSKVGGLTKRWCQLKTYYGILKIDKFARLDKNTYIRIK